MAVSPANLLEVVRGKTLMDTSVMGQSLIDGCKKTDGNRGIWSAVSKARRLSPAVVIEHIEGRACLRLPQNFNFLSVVSSHQQLWLDSINRLNAGRRGGHG